MTARKILLGNEAIAVGLAESACTMATSYPGTPASEVLSTLVQLKKAENLQLHLEWSINEKVAFEVALANSFAGRRSVAIMKQVGLNVAADPLMSAAYTGVKGGFVLVVADDPGPHSSQTEQDSRFLAMMAKVPVLDPSSPAEARDMLPQAFSLSEQYEIPVMFRPTTRVCHARQDMELRPFPTGDAPPQFEKNPTRWAATPKFRLILHGQLNEKLSNISREPSLAPKFLNEIALATAEKPRICIVASGVVLAHAKEIMMDLGLWTKIPIYQVPMPYPLPRSFRDEILSQYDRILVLEETDPVIELQLQNREKVFGRITGTVPSAGELLPEAVEEIVRTFAHLPPAPRIEPPNFPGRRPTLCAGCPHRATFFAIKKAFPKGIYPGDIGCYTLGVNLGAVDTVLCMGASISQAAGFYHAYRTLPPEEAPAVCATIGDSTFFHAGIPALINAVVQGGRFTLVILDNSTTAMTGHQPTPASGHTLDGTPVPQLSIPEIVKACGVRFVEVEDPYRLDALIDLLKKAGGYTRSEKGGVAVVVAKHPCLMDRAQSASRIRREVTVNEKCKGCGLCIKQFECPALVSQGEKEPIRIDSSLCSGCGVCVHVCPHGALTVVPKNE
ncbi:MAG: indolepyruvate ferredoxin oxidoreductase subunit alpha [Deltaproteobacteria bacterium]|nr:indolepyruvate ferredoxin oxidoreductase subunit alpha [Deltaproteobacteria bacterium]